MRSDSTLAGSAAAAELSAPTVATSPIVDGSTPSEAR